MQIFEEVSYDPKVDACYIRLKKDKIQDSEIKRDWLIIDKDKNWNIVWIEILNAKRHKSLIGKLVLSEKNIEKCVSF